MRNSIKLLATISAILSANVFAAGIAPDLAESRSYVLQFSKFVEDRNRLSHTQGSEFPGANLGMQATCKRHDEQTYMVFDKIMTDFFQSAGSEFPNAKLIRFELDEFHLFSDAQLMKYEPGIFEATKEAIEKNIKPFYAEFSNVMLCVKYTDKDGEKKVLFLPNSDDQEDTISNLHARNIDARPIAQLKEFVPTEDFEGRRILDSTLVISLETGGLIERMIHNLSEALLKDALGPIVRAESDNPVIDSLPVVGIKGVSFMSPSSATVIESALNFASDQLSGKDLTGSKKVETSELEAKVAKYNIDFNRLRLSLGLDYKYFTGEFK